MRQAGYLAPATNPLVFTLNWSARTALIDNPTGSAIYMRQGGSDTPTPTNADHTIPAQTMEQIPVVGNQFAFSLATPATVGVVTPSAQATILLLDANEPVSAIGSVQPVNRPVYYDRNHIKVGGLYLADGVGPHANVTRANYTVPINRKAFIEGAYVGFIRQIAATTAGVVQAIAQLSNAVGAGQYLALAYAQDNTVNAPHFDHMAGNIAMVAGDSVSLISGDASTGGTLAYRMSVQIGEYDA